MYFQPLHVHIPFSDFCHLPTAILFFRHKAIADYLFQCGFEDALNAFKKDANMVRIEFITFLYISFTLCFAAVCCQISL